MAEGTATGLAVLSEISRLREMIVIIDRMALFVSNDTEPIHIAAGLGVPTIGLFRSSAPAKYQPWGKHTRVI